MAAGVGMTTTPRTTLRIFQPLPAPTVLLYTYDQSAPLGVVQIADDSVEFVASDPVDLRRIAEAFLDAAYRLECELERREEAAA